MRDVQTLTVDEVKTIIDESKPKKNKNFSDLAREVWQEFIEKGLPFNRVMMAIRLRQLAKPEQYPSYETYKMRTDKNKIKVIGKEINRVLPNASRKDEIFVDITDPKFTWDDYLAAELPNIVRDIDDEEKHKYRFACWAETHRGDSQSRLTPEAAYDYMKELAIILKWAI